MDFLVGLVFGFVIGAAAGGFVVAKRINAKAFKALWAKGGGSGEEGGP